jgi:predicted phosphodiesterase
MMRIVQLSDIHLSGTNLPDLQNFYREALLNDLRIFHEEKRIDVILLTGDLVDRGGKSLGENPYSVFENEFIKPLLKELDLKREQILFIPGNHDINRDLIEERSEFFLANTLTKDEANKLLQKTRTAFTEDNRRQEQFKEFEKEFHKNNDSYIFSNNESLTIIDSENFKTGFALINDSWRCSSELKKEQHFIGYSQLFIARNYFKEQKTNINVAVFHHPLELLNSSEKEEIENILRSKEFDVAIFGHSHEQGFESIITSTGGLITLNGRAAFNNSAERDTRFQPGYNILDLNISGKTYTLYTRKFIKGNGYRFDKDVESAPDGIFSGRFNQDRYIPLSQAISTSDPDLPSGYSADVTRVVRLLIGKSLYPNQYIFVRELIQNAVDACHRLKEKNYGAEPKIKVHINREQGYFEVSDEGDGMSKKVLREHFSIIGKSISEEFNEGTGKVNLIAQFGIGFISTFIVAQKVAIFTKNEHDDCIQFEINDVFKGFQYNTTPILNQISGTGTIVRVYLKKEYSIDKLWQIAHQNCRHLDNIEFYLNYVQQQVSENWNVEDGIFLYSEKNSKYEVRLAIGEGSRALIASNSGFLITTYPAPIIPTLFPYIIGGEVNFMPKTIDFDISRSNIIETQKSIEFRRELSVSLRVLFRQVIESNNENLKQIVLRYLQFYLTVIESYKPHLVISYKDFYSKKELIQLCVSSMKFEFENKNMLLSEIISSLSEKSIKKIYFPQSNPMNDFDHAVTNYLRGAGNLVIAPETITVHFRDGQRAFSMLNVMQLICAEYGFELTPINKVASTLMGQMLIEKSTLPANIRNQIDFIEKENHTKIEIASLGSYYKPFFILTSTYFINYNHYTFQDLLYTHKEITDEMVGCYLCGLLGLSIITGGQIVHNFP